MEAVIQKTWKCKVKIAEIQIGIYSKSNVGNHFDEICLRRRQAVQSIIIIAGAHLFH